MIRLWWLLCCVIAVNKGGRMSELFCGENGRMESAFGCVWVMTECDVVEGVLRLLCGIFFG